MSQPRTYDPVAMRVVTLLGGAAVSGLIAAATLCYFALTREGNENAAVVIAIVGNLASAALASLGSILASTGSKGTPTPVEVTNKPSDPVPTAPTGGYDGFGAPISDPGYAVGDPAAPLKEN